MKSNQKNILITGGAGYIGSHISELLIKQNYNIFIFDNLVTGYRKLLLPKTKFIKGDIKDKKKLITVINKNNINSIIHLAAYLNVSEAERNKKAYYKNNVIGTKNIIEACKNSKVENIIFSSSCSVYGNVVGSVAENIKPNPMGYYAYTKFQSEKIIKKFSDKYKYRYGILRYFNVAGASKSRKIGEIETSHGHLIKNLAIQSLKKNPLVKIFGNKYKTKDGTCIRDYIHVSDLADIHIKSLKYLIDNKKSFILNCGYGKGYSVKQIVNIFKKLKKNTKIIILPKRKGDIGQVFANTNKFKKILKWRPKYNDISLIIKSAINWEKKLNKF